jgi:hypothetical protein
MVEVEEREAHLRTSPTLAVILGNQHVILLRSTRMQMEEA